MSRKRSGSTAVGPLAKRVCSRWLNVSYQLRLDGVQRPAHVPDSVGSTSCQSTTTETKLVSPSSVKVGIECAGNGGDFVKQEGATAMTKAREPAPTVVFIEDYCAHYRPVFPNCRQFDQSTRLGLGLVAGTNRN